LLDFELGIPRGFVEGSRFDWLAEDLARELSVDVVAIPNCLELVLELKKGNNQGNWLMNSSLAHHFVQLAGDRVQETDEEAHFVIHDRQKEGIARVADVLQLLLHEARRDVEELRP
jgi:hypothetical protein